ncbi:MAG: ABC transporter substrate-binding protein [Candidatus Heimdallarchaeota archaeon]
MNTRKPKMLFLLCIMLGSAFLVLANEPTPAASSTSALPTTIKIGYLWPETGALSAYELNKGGALAEKLVNAAGGHGTWTGTLDVIFEDTATDPTTTAAAATKLIETDGVEVIVGAAGSSNTLAAAKVAAQNEVPIVSYASTSPAITTEGGEWVFRVVGSDELQGWALAEMCLAMGYTSAAMIYLDNAYGIGMADVFYEYFVGGGGEVVQEFKYVETATSFSTEITKIKSLEDAGDIDVIMDTSYADDGALIFTEAATQGITTPWACAEGVGDAKIFDVTSGVGAAMMGMRGTKPLSFTESTGWQTFNTSYWAEYGTAQNIYGDYSYDAIYLVLEAIIAADSYDGPAIKTALPTTANGWVLATGDKSMDANGDVGQDYSIWEVTEPTTGNYEFTVQGGWNFLTGASFSAGGVTKTYHGTERTPRPEEEEEDSPGFMAIIALVSLAGAATLILRRRRS